MTNHRSTKKGAIQGGFDRKALFQEVEKGFDELFSHNRKLDESFEYYNVMKNGTIDEQLEMQEKQLVIDYFAIFSLCNFKVFSNLLQAYHTTISYSKTTFYRTGEQLSYMSH